MKKVTLKEAWVCPIEWEEIWAQAADLQAVHVENGRLAQQSGTELFSLRRRSSRQPGVACGTQPGGRTIRLWTVEPMTNECGPRSETRF